MSHTLDTSRIEEIFEGLEENRHKFNEWEQKFLTSVREQYEDIGKLSERQFEILESLWLKI